MRFGRSDDGGTDLRFRRAGPARRNDPFLRFGKRGDPFLRFGKRGDPFLRFGKRGDPFLRFGKRGDPFLRFGKRGDPFLRFGKRGDPFLRFGKNDPYLRFGRSKDGYLVFGKRSAETNEEPTPDRQARRDVILRFGRGDPFLRFGKGDPFLRFGKGDPFLRFGKGDPFLRFGKGDPFLRFGKGDPFLRFGKTSTEEGPDATAELVSLEDDGAAGQEALRKKRDVSTDVDSPGVLTTDMRLGDKPQEVQGAIVGEKEKATTGSLLEGKLSALPKRSRYMRFGRSSINSATTGKRHLLMRFGRASKE